MRSPGRKRPPPKERVEPPEGTDLEVVAAEASYVGSPEHKEYPHGGVFSPRPDASKCDPHTGSMEELTEWLRAGIRSGNVSYFDGPRFPKYVWFRRGEDCYIARLINRESGEYKGWPLQSSGEVPSWL